ERVAEGAISLVPALEPFGGHLWHDGHDRGPHSRQEQASAIDAALAKKVVGKDLGRLVLKPDELPLQRRRARPGGFDGRQPHGERAVGDAESLVILTVWASRYVEHSDRPGLLFELLDLHVGRDVQYLAHPAHAHPNMFSIVARVELFTTHRHL